MKLSSVNYIKTNVRNNKNTVSKYNTYSKPLNPTLNLNFKGTPLKSNGFGKMQALTLKAQTLLGLNKQSVPQSETKDEDTVNKISDCVTNGIISKDDAALLTRLPDSKCKIALWMILLQNMQGRKISSYEINFLSDELKKLSCEIADEITKSDETFLKIMSVLSHITGYVTAIDENNTRIAKVAETNLQDFIALDKNKQKIILNELKTDDSIITKENFGLAVSALRILSNDEISEIMKDEEKFLKLIELFKITRYSRNVFTYTNMPDNMFKRLRELYDSDYRICLETLQQGAGIASLSTKDVEDKDFNSVITLERNINEGGLENFFRMETLENDTVIGRKYGAASELTLKT